MPEGRCWGRVLGFLVASERSVWRRDLFILTTVMRVYMAVELEGGAN